MIRHIAGIAEIVDDMEAAVRFYRDVLGLQVKYEQGSGHAIVTMPGILYFGIWQRAEAAKATFGDAAAADRIPLGFTVGFEVDSVDEASEALKDKGWQIAQPPQKEPWGQVTSRFFSPSGALSEVSEMPPARRIVQQLRAAEESSARRVTR
jgi:catechol 2,3-dioxygenase-like lactoylglutathione lyase family enzyme